MPNALRQVIVAAIAYLVWRGILSLAEFHYQLFRDPFSFPGLLVDFAVLAISLALVELVVAAVFPASTAVGRAPARPAQSTEPAMSAPPRKTPSKSDASWTQVLVAGDIQKQIEEEEAAAASASPAEPPQTAPAKKTPSKSDSSWTQVLVAGDIRKQVEEEAKRKDEESD